MCLIIGTLFFDRTTFTFWFTSNALVSSEEDKWMMQYAFLFQRKNLLDFPIGLFWSPSRYNSDTIHDSVNMRVDTNVRHIIENREDDLCCFYSYSWESLNQCEIIRNNSRVFLGQDCSRLFDKARFVSIEIYIFEIFFHFFKRYIYDIVCFSYFCEKWRSNFIYLLICSLC